MAEIFPETIRKLPEADLPFDGCRAFLSQAEEHQIMFMEFTREVAVPEHSHAAQYAVVLAGKIEMVIGGDRRIYTRGDQYYIPAGVMHSARIYPGYADITFFNEPSRYRAK